MRESHGGVSAHILIVTFQFCLLHRFDGEPLGDCIEQYIRGHVESQDACELTGLEGYLAKRAERILACFGRAKCTAGMACLGHTTQSTGYGQPPFLLQLWRTDSTSLLMVAFEDSSIASSRQWRWYTWTGSHSAPIAHTRAAFYSVVERRVTTGKEERWPSGWRLLPACTGG